ncbi:hypothetical protein CVT24_006444 [Panaeolus cyanescens]|uniref:CCHC-type domain-containing protein n=1 Tax=Panaeolus cyanescens TaxID=181874 RepID=A0A409X6A2_9AGAR|nr:hypothetical protein CVT24_006444 [Panaeolus cyanescens]
MPRKTNNSQQAIDYLPGGFDELPRRRADSVLSESRDYEAAESEVAEHLTGIPEVISRPAQALIREGIAVTAYRDVPDFDDVPQPSKRRKPTSAWVEDARDEGDTWGPSASRPSTPTQPRTKSNPVPRPVRQDPPDDDDPGDSDGSDDDQGNGGGPPRGPPGPRRSRSASRGQSESNDDRLVNILEKLLDRSSRPASTSSDVKSKVREPQVFDGKDRNKLHTWLTLMAINFNDRPKTFASDEKKVNFAISYLSGTALDWFEPGIMAKINGQRCPKWVYDYSEFVRILKQQFGPWDPEEDAEEQLENLTMGEKADINVYQTEFSRIMARLPENYGEAPLVRQFYRGLPDRIKDEICRVGKPKSLLVMRQMAWEIDHRWHERNREIRRAAKTHGSSSSQNSSNHVRHHTNSNQGSNSSTSQPQKSQNFNQPKTSSTSGSGKGQNSDKSKTSDKEKKPWADKLDKGGKLTPEERKRRAENNLCNYCGAPGHKAADCPKPTSRSAKARAAQVQPTSESESVKQ